MQTGKTRSILPGIWRTNRGSARRHFQPCEFFFPVSCVPTGGTATTHCDLPTSYPGAVSTGAAAVEGIGAQLGFRVPNLVISPFTRKHYVSHIPRTTPR